MSGLGLRAAFLSQALSLAGLAAAGAQPAASSLAELERLANATVTVIDTQGREVRGVVDSATESALVLRHGSEVRRFDGADIASVRVRKGDGLVNGSLIGAAAGAGATSLIFLDNECRGDAGCYGAVAAYAGVGALAGAGIDALIRRQVVVYTAPGRGASPVVTVAPLAAHGRRGLRLSVAF